MPPWMPPELNAQHGVRQLRFQLVKARLAQTARRISDDTSHSATNAILLVPVLGNQISHSLARFLARTPHRVEVIYLFSRDSINQLQKVGI
ncbi:hypothetical protein AC579_879 [Pseudocercospora musae]|uniref:Uncharacterized protein n=1 Tax=Pseudocercospora musae TaxID=113226 RepID=A0A139GYK2_9PEZI|nr:hypothetical protein AC579_879 [Pseudocercospora musae]